MGQNICAGRARGAGVPSPHRHLEGWEASHGGPVLKGGGIQPIEHVANGQRGMILSPVSPNLLKLLR